MNNFKMSFWNYVDIDVLDAKEAVKDWKQLGMNLPMSFEFNPEKHDKKQMLKLLDECEKQDMKVIVCDKRTNFRTLSKIGKDAFKKGATAAAADFASHKAVWGFHVGDEPDKTQWQDFIDAYKMVKNAAPHLSPYINFFPLWDEDNFETVLGVKGEDYGKLLDKAVKDAGLEMMCYDYYGQCSYSELPRYTNLYIKNLLIFGDVARKNNIPLYTTLLSVGHWNMYCPKEDDIRWQTSVAAALGVTGIWWFFIYERTLDSSFRTPPIDLFWEKTETFEWLSRQNRTFMKFHAEKFANLKYDQAYNINHNYGELPSFNDAKMPFSVNFIINETAPMLISRFYDKNGKAVYVVVNLERELPVKIQIKSNDENNKNGLSDWLAPGQLRIVEGL